MRLTKDRLVWSDIRGRNGYDSPIKLPDDQAVEVLNVDFSDGALGRKRRGSNAEDLTSGPTTTIRSIFCYFPSGDGDSPEMWAFSDTTNLFRRAPNLGAGTYPWSTPTVSDGPQADYNADAVAFNGKLFLAYDTVVNRLHVWDGTSVRRVGLAPASAAATVANTGAGAYAATLRYYKVAFAEISGSTTVRRSELSASVSFTPSGAGTAARVTRPTAPGESETHWLLYASTDDVYSNYKLIATTAIATTTYDDSTAPASYSGNAPQIAGLNVPPPSARFIITDGNRLILAGAFETSAGSGQTVPKNNRVWFTRVLGSSDIGDDETIPNTSATGLTPAQKNWLDLGIGTSQRITGLGIVNGVIFVFTRTQTWRLVPTGDDLLPYRSVLVSNVIGSVNHRSIVAGEQKNGEPALYFVSPRGPYRVTVSGNLEYVGREVFDLFDETSQSSTTFSLYHQDLRQVWIRCGPTTAAIYDVTTQGWSKFTLPFTANAGMMFPEAPVTVAVGLSSASPQLKPYLAGTASSAAKLSQFDYDAAYTDGGTAYQAYVLSKPYFPAGLGSSCLLHDAELLAEATSGTTITVTITGDHGATGQSKTATALLTAAGSETRVSKRLEDSALGGIAAVQFQIGDGSALNQSWVLDGISVRVKPQEDLA